MLQFDTFLPGILSCGNWGLQYNYLDSSMSLNQVLRSIISEPKAKKLSPVSYKRIVWKRKKLWQKEEVIFQLILNGQFRFT